MWLIFQRSGIEDFRPRRGHPSLPISVSAPCYLLQEFKSIFMRSVRTEKLLLYLCICLCLIVFLYLYIFEFYIFMCLFFVFLLFFCKKRLSFSLLSFWLFLLLRFVFCLFVFECFFLFIYLLILYYISFNVMYFCVCFSFLVVLLQKETFLFSPSVLAVPTCWSNTISLSLRRTALPTLLCKTHRHHYLHCHQ